MSALPWCGATTSCSRWGTDAPQEKRRRRSRGAAASAGKGSGFPGAGAEYARADKPHSYYTWGADGAEQGSCSSRKLRSARAQRKGAGTRTRFHLSPHCVAVTVVPCGRQCCSCLVLVPVLLCTRLLLAEAWKQARMRRSPCLASGASTSQTVQPGLDRKEPGAKAALPLFSAPRATEPISEAWFPALPRALPSSPVRQRNC